MMAKKRPVIALSIRCLLCPGHCPSFVSLVKLSLHISSTHHGEFERIQGVSGGTRLYVCAVCQEQKFCRLVNLMNHVFIAHRDHSTTGQNQIERTAAIESNMAGIQVRKKRRGKPVTPNITTRSFSKYFVVIGDAYYCELCPFSTRRGEQHVVKHSQGHISSRKGHRCPLCGFSDNSMDVVKQHLLHLCQPLQKLRKKRADRMTSCDDDGAKTWDCPFCQHTMMERKVQLQHIKRHRVRNETLNICNREKCKFACADMRVIKYHNKYHHKDRDSQGAEQPEAGGVNQGASTSGAARATPPPMRITRDSASNTHRIVSFPAAGDEHPFTPQSYHDQPATASSYQSPSPVSGAMPSPGASATPAAAAADSNKQCPYCSDSMDRRHMAAHLHFYHKDWMDQGQSEISDAYRRNFNVTRPQPVPEPAPAGSAAPPSSPAQSTPPGQPPAQPPVQPQPAQAPPPTSAEQQLLIPLSAPLNVPVTGAGGGPGTGLYSGEISGNVPCSTSSSERELSTSTWCYDGDNI